MKNVYYITERATRSAIPFNVDGSLEVEIQRKGLVIYEPLDYLPMFTSAEKALVYLHKEVEGWEECEKFTDGAHSRIATIPDERDKTHKVTHVAVATYKSDYGDYCLRTYQIVKVEVW